MKIVVCGNYGAQNFGDELILEGLLQTLKATTPKAEITVMNGNPVEIAKTYNVKSIPKFPAGLRSFFTGSEATTKAVKSCDYFILGGGGLFNDLSIHANMIWALQARQAIKFKKPLIIYGQSVGPLTTIGKYIVKNIFKQAAFISVRDQDSVTELKKLGIEKEIFVTPDLAFRLPSIPALDSEKDTVIFSLRDLADFPDAAVKELGKFCNWLVEWHNCHLEFIDFQQGEKSDSELHRKIISQISNKNHVEHFPHIISTKDLLTHFSKAKFIFGMRMHSVICAMKAGKPFIAISYSRKIDSLIKDSGLEDYLVPYKHLSQALLKKLFIILKDKESIVKTKLQQLNKKNLEKHLIVEKKLKDFLSAQASQ